MPTTTAMRMIVVMGLETSATRLLFPGSHLMQIP